MEKVNQVIHIEENKLFNEKIIVQELIPGMILNYANPNLALVFTINSLPKIDSRLKSIIDKFGFVYSNHKLYDKKDNELDKNFVYQAVLNDIDEIIEKEKKDEKDYSYSILDLLKEFLEKDLKPLLYIQDTKKVPSDNMTVEELMAKLNGNKPEEGVKKVC